MRTPFTFIHLANLSILLQNFWQKSILRSGARKRTTSSMPPCRSLQDMHSRQAKPCCREHIRRKTRQEKTM